MEKRCNGHVVSVNNLVAKWRRSADSLLCLPSPPLLSVSSVHVPLSTTRGRDEAGCSFCKLAFPPSMAKKEKRELKESSSVHPHTCSLDSLRSYTAEDCPTLDVLWETTLSYCSGALGLTLLLFDKVHVRVRLRDSGARVRRMIWEICPDGSFSWCLGLCAGLRTRAVC